MTTQMTNYKCPSCTAPLHFVGSSGKLECDYCGSKFDVAEIEDLYGQKETEAKEAFSAVAEDEAEQDAWNEAALNKEWDGRKMRSYNCPSCGAQLICDESTAALSCPYCGNATVIPGQFSGVLQPDYMIPFQLDLKEAKAGLKKYYQGKILLPKGFKAENRLDKIQGVYVPFWMFDGRAEVQAVFETTQSSTRISGDYEITETRHYTVERAGSVTFERIPVDASSKMPDHYMDALEPFDYGQLQDYSSGYLPGYLADKYDVSVKSCAPRAEERASRSAIAAMQDDVTGYESCILKEHQVHLHRGKVHYALLPVYLLNTHWKGKKYLFAMNGQTGKIVGNLPISWAKWWALLLGIMLPLTAIITTIVEFCR